MHQERSYPERVSGTALQNPDFCALAKAYGYEAFRMHETQEFEGLLKDALARNVGTLIEVMLDPEVITTRGSLSEITQNAQKKRPSDPHTG